MPERKWSFHSVFAEGVLECLFELEEAFLYVLIPVILVFGLCFLAVMVYHWTFDLNAAELGSSSDLLSIDPDKWFPRS